MPLGPIVDSHVHLWDPTRFRMPWLDGNERIGKPFGLAEFREHSAGIEVEGTGAITSVLVPSNGSVPVNALKSMTPTLYQSVAAVKPAAVPCSGDM